MLIVGLFEGISKKSKQKWLIPVVSFKIIHKFKENAFNNQTNILNLLHNQLFVTKQVKTCIFEIFLC